MRVTLTCWARSTESRKWPRSMAKRIANSRVADIDEREVLRDEQFRVALKCLAREQGLEFEEAEQYAAKCLDELAVRPEDIHLEAKESGSAEEQNQTPGTIESLEYLGAFVRATVKLHQSGARVQADLSSGNIDPSSMGAQTAVAVTFPADKIRLYPLGT